MIFLLTGLPKICYRKLKFSTPPILSASGRVVDDAGAFGGAGVLHDGAGGARPVGEARSLCAHSEVEATKKSIGAA